MDRNVSLLWVSWLTIGVLHASNPSPGERSLRVPPPAKTIRKPITLTPYQAARVGHKIWQNESGGKRSGLTHWNVGENFPSLGIGHFIWYPEGQQDRFKESFPGLVEELENADVSLPAWLTSQTPCPWESREEFLNQVDSPRMKQLRDLLARTVGIQTKYILLRMRSALPTMLQKVSRAHDREVVVSHFSQLETTPEGVFALADYTNFKGEGVSPHERYNGQGWGLLQVLLEMDTAESPRCSLKNFAKAAERVLRRRVQNDPGRGESRWLKGWLKRVHRYEEIWSDVGEVCPETH